MNDTMYDGIIILSCPVLLLVIFVVMCFCDCRKEHRDTVYFHDHKKYNLNPGDSIELVNKIIYKIN